MRTENRQALRLAVFVLAFTSLGGCSPEQPEPPSGEKESPERPAGRLKHDTTPVFRTYRPQSASGLTSLGIDPVKPGRGAVIKPGDWVHVRYKGTLADGTVFDESGAQPVPLKLEQGQVIEGWIRGLVGQREGAVVKLAIPAAMAYGEKSQGKVPANADLYFEVEVVKVN